MNPHLTDNHTLVYNEGMVINLNDISAILVAIGAMLVPVGWLIAWVSRLSGRIATIEAHNSFQDEAHGRMEASINHIYSKVNSHGETLAVIRTLLDDHLTYCRAAKI